jgi:hypothetical protein
MAARLKFAIGGLLFCGWLAGCASCPEQPSRPFEFGRDQFAFRNELRWIYTFDDAGKTASRKIHPPPDYALHCLPMARAAREFFYHARFEPALPKKGASDYENLARAVVGRDSRCPSPPDQRIVFPGFANLTEFSRVHETLLKRECGASWNSYAQRGNWRMILPFSRRHQGRTAAALERKLADGFLPIIHLVDFPGLKINHAVLVTSGRAEGDWIFFEAYDPNNPEHPARLRFDRNERRFMFERNSYFAGGAVDVYEVFKNAIF